MKSLLMLSVFVFVSFISFSQTDKIKFGKIDVEDLKMQTYDKDTSAVAVILFEKGTEEIEYNQTLGWKLKFSKHQRIKILKEEGVDYADFQIRLNVSGSEEEEVTKLKAITFNLENGKILKDELDKKDVHLEEVNKYINLKSFSLPNVRVGSVIDVEYSINCKAFFRNMRPWMFQHSIPTVYSEYEVKIPEYFKFRQFVLGFEEFTTSEQTSSMSDIVLTSKSTSGGTFNTGPVKTEFNYDKIRLQNNVYHWIAENMPEFKEEAYTSTVDNFIQQVQFELQSIQFPNSTPHTYSQSWESINKNLTEDEDFGKIVFSQAKFLLEETEKLISGATDNMEKVNILLNHVRDNYKFNGFHSIYSKGLRTTIKNMSGNVADINFLLAAYLRSAGFEIKPVALSTRSNGVFVFPTVTGFNYVVLQCNVDGKNILLDAADDYSGINELPYKCLNGRGLVIGGSVPEWIEMLEVGRSDVNYISNLTIEETGKLSGKVGISRKGYSAQSFRSKVASFNSVDKYTEDFAAKNHDWEIESHSVEGIDELNTRVLENIDLSLSNNSIFAGDMIYLSPVIFNVQDENPFKLKERKYPVDFGFAIKENEMNIITIPKGYSVEEFPESCKIGLPEGKVVYMFSARKLNENQIQIVSNLVINKPVLYAEDYENLKELFNLIIEKEKQQIILKKI
ncbi:MAG: DUF3857 and transglutaminase domain-containing protein [Marinifilaceae bacterium]|nr:DUF3857 and transglutaminase domain-containing protein [Marinifilaceae bacterium]